MAAAQMAMILESVDQGVDGKAVLESAQSRAENRFALHALAAE